jgi:hypothetical protein
VAKDRKTAVKFEAIPGRMVVIARFKGQYSIACPGLGVRLVSKAEDALDHVANVLLPPLPDGRPNRWTPTEPDARESLLLSIAELANDDRS